MQSANPRLSGVHLWMKITQNRTPLIHWRGTYGKSNLLLHSYVQIIDREPTLLGYPIQSVMYLHFRK